MVILVDLKPIVTDYAGKIVNAATNPNTFFNSIGQILAGFIITVATLIVMDMVSRGDYFGLAFVVIVLFALVFVVLVLANVLKQRFGIDLYASFVRLCGAMNTPVIPSNPAAPDTPAEPPKPGILGVKFVTDADCANGAYDIDWNIWNQQYGSTKLIVCPASAIPAGLFSVYFNGSGSHAPFVFYDPKTNTIYADDKQSRFAERAKTVDELYAEFCDAPDKIKWLVYHYGIDKVKEPLETLINPNQKNLGEGEHDAILWANICSNPTMWLDEERAIFAQCNPGFKIPGSRL